MVLIATLWLIAYENRELRKEVSSLTERLKGAFDQIEKFADAEAAAPPKQYVYRTPDFRKSSGKHVWSSWTYIPKDKYDDLEKSIPDGM